MNPRPFSSTHSARLAWLFLLPALVLLAVFVGYPLLFTVLRSLYDRTGTEFVGLGNYVGMFDDERTLLAIRNTALWILVAPAVVTGFGLVLAVLTERVRWAAAFRLVLFMPMAISLFASGIVFRLVYEENPERGLVNAVTVSVHDALVESARYPGARPAVEDAWSAGADGFTSRRSYQSGDVVALPLVGLPQHKLPAAALEVRAPTPGRGELRGLVWLENVGRNAAPDLSERGMPGLAVEALRGGTVVARVITGDDGEFTFPDLARGEHTLRLPAEGFTPPFRGLTWLGPGLITPVIMSAWVWIMTGFAVTFIAAGLAALPRDSLEAARVDGATEWQVLRRVTVPLLSPVLLVVFVALVINALKVFELVFVIAPGSVQAEANVLALQLWQVSFTSGGDQGLGSALGVILVLLVLPAGYLNIRRFRPDRR